MSDDDDSDANFSDTDQQKFRDPKSRGGRTGSGRSGNGRHPNSVKNLRSWRPGESGNPAGVSKMQMDVVRLARDEGPASIAKLAELRDDPKVPARVQLEAAIALLDRGYGKPAAAIYHGGTITGLEIEPEEGAGLSALLARARLAKGIHQ